MFDDDSYPIYRRRDNGAFTYRKIKKGNRMVELKRNNCHVAPYNPYLLLKYKCHLNVEFVGAVKSVQYIYKYIYKGHDAAELKIVGDEECIIYDETSRHIDGRYVSFF